MHMLQVHVLNISVVLDVYCICFMLSVSCFGTTFGETHGFLHVHTKRSTRGRSRVWAGGASGPRVAFFLGNVVGTHMPGLG
jgi:hypothetical protein